MGDIKDILYKLVSVQSDTGTKKEINMAEFIFSMIREQEYFKEHPELCGCFYNNDFIGRPVVWALRRGKSNKTILLTGHYDAVEIDSYGAIKEYALKPDELKEKLKSMNPPEDVRKDLESNEWHFGRGINDMKAGIAINIDAVSSAINDDVNVLFFAVHDEENLSAGMRQSIKLLCELKEKYTLDYRLVLVTEPHGRKREDTFKIATGAVGKIMPAIVIKGKIAHSSNVIEGLNSTAIMSEIISNAEMNPELCSTDKTMTSPPPTVLYARDLKEFYDVSIPEFSALYLNYQFLKVKTPFMIIEELRGICRKSFEKVIERYYREYDVLDRSGCLEGRNKRKFEPKVYTFEEIEKIAEKNNNDYSKLKVKLYNEIYKRVSKNEMTMQDAGIAIIKGTIDMSMTTEPMIVIGFIPPYYPATNNRYLEGYKESYEDVIEQTLSCKYGLKLEKESYFMGICDGSYTSCTDRKGEEEVMANMVTPVELYSIPFDDIEKISAPFIGLGPWGKEYHTINERVYMPDVVETVPDLIRKIINIL